LEPLVSVICITRNHERFCIESLDSVLNQTYKNIEWIILDAASNDSTVELIDSWLVENNIKAIFLKEKELKPITVNLNKALEYAHGAYVQFLSLDDVLVNSKLKRDVHLLNASDSTYSLVFGVSQIIDDKSNFLFQFIPNNVMYESGGNYFSQLINGNIISAPSVMIKLAALRSVGCFNETWKIEDYSLYLKLSSLGHNFIYNPVLNSFYRKHGSSFSKSLDFQLEELSLLSEYIFMPEVKYIIRKKLLHYAAHNRSLFEKGIELYMKTQKLDLKLKIHKLKLPLKLRLFIINLVFK